MKKNILATILSIIGLILAIVVVFLIIGMAKNKKPKPTTTRPTTTTKTKTTENPTTKDPLPKYDFEIIYNLDGGENNPNNPNGFNSGETVTLLEPIKLGYDFEGWYTSETFTGNPITEISLDLDFELFAKFEIHHYTITYYNVDGLTNPNATDYTINDSIITLIDVDRYSSEFNGWYTTSTFDSESKITEIDPTTLKDYELYAQFEIIKTDPTVNVQAKNLTYTGDEQELLNVNVSGGTIYYSLDNENYTIEMPKAKNANTYNIYYKVIGDEYHFDLLDQSIQVTIGKASYDMSGITFTDMTVTYTGETYFNEITGNLPTGVSVSYENNGQATVGIYEIIAKFSGDYDNFYPISNMDAALIINKASYDMSGVTFINKEVTYDGNAQSITITGILPEGVTVTYENNNQTTVGSYEVIAKFSGDSTNYEAISNMSATLKINKTSYDMSNVTFSDKTVTYNGESQSIIINGTLPSGVSVSYENNDKTIAGTYTVTAIFSGDATNYNLISNMTATLKINKAVYDMSQITFDDDTVTYDGNEHSILISGTLPSGVSVSYDNNGQTTVGTYTITATFTGDATNYELISDMTATLIISKKAYDMSRVYFENETVTYDSYSHSITITGYLPDGVSVEYENNGKINAGTYTVIAKFSGDATNYELIPNKTAILTIEKGDYNMSGIRMFNKEVTYNGYAYSITITGTLAQGVTVSYENNDKINAGTYTVIAHFTGDTINHNEIPDLTATLIINKATYDMSDITFTGDEVIYNGNPYSIAITGTLPDGVSVEYENNGKINFGTYTVIAKFSGDEENYELISDMEATLIINKATYDMSGITFNGDEVTYDGNVHSLAISGTLPDGVSVEYENNDKTNYGTYTVIAKFTSNNPNYNAISDMEAILIINKATATYTLPTAITNLVYNENAQALVNAGSVNVGSLEYSLDGENWSTTISTATVPNTYTVSYRFVLNDNYEAIDGGQINVEIEKATIDMSNIELNDKTVNYTGSSQSITIDGTLNSNVTVNYTGEGTVVGTYPITATFTVDTDLYNEISDLTATLTITPATIKNVTVTGYAAIVDGNAHNIVVEKTATTVDNSEMTWLFSKDQENWLTELTATNPEDSGTYYFKINAANHNEYTGHFEVIITEKNVTTIEITNLDSLNKVYDGSPTTTPIISTNSDNETVTITYSTDGTTFTSDVPVNANHYTIKVDIEETATYARASIQKTFDISKATYDMSGIIFDNQTYTYDGSSHSLAISGTLPEGVTVSYENNDKTTVGTYVVTAEFSGDTTNYELISDMTATLQITKATYDMSGVTFDNQTYTYDGSSHSLAISGTLPEGVTVSYENNDKTVVDSYIVTAKFTGDSTNYELISDMTATLQITKASYDMSTVAFDDVTIDYDKLTHRITITGTLPTGVTVSYNDTNSYSHVGTYEYTASFSGDTTNYELISDMTATLTINKATIDMSGVVFNDLTVDYDGTAKSITASNIPTDIISTSYDGNGVKNAGTYTITASFIVDEENYNVVNDMTAILTINKVEIDTRVVVFNDATYTYNKTARSITASNLPDGVTVDYTNNNQTNAGTYIVTATFVYDTVNYTVTVAYKTSTLTINKATINMSGVTFNDATFTYDGNVKSLAVSGTIPSEITKVNYTNNNQINAGSYTVTASFEYDTDNYNTVDDMEATLIINKVSYDTSVVVFEDATFTYDKTAKSIYATNVPSGVQVAYTNNGQINASTYTVRVTFSISDSTNYEVTVPYKEATLTINKATIDMTGVTFENGTFTYDGSAKSIYVSNNLPEEITSVNYTNNGQVNASTYTVTASFEYDPDNYNDVDNMTATLTINKASIDTSVVGFSNVTVDYDGTAKSIMATNLPTSITVDYTNNGQINAGTYTITATFVYDTVNYTVTVASKTATLKINKINPPYTLPTNLKANVGQTLADITLPSGFTFNDPLTTSVGAEGNNTFMVTYTPDDPINYNTLSNLEVTIAVTEAKVYEIICTNNQSKTYNALEQGPTVTVKLDDEVVSNNFTLSYAYKLTTASSYTSGLPTNAGTYNIKINCSGSEGNNAQEVVVTFTINKAMLTVTTTNIALEYASDVRTWAQVQANIPTINVTGLLGSDTTTISVVGMHNGKYKYGTVSGSYIAPTADTIFGASYNNVIGSTYLVIVSQNNTNYDLNDYQIIFKYKTAKISSTFYTIEDALTASGTITFAGDSSGAQTYVATAFTSLATSITGYNTTYTVSGRTLIVPYANNTNNKSDVVGTTSGNVYTALIMHEGITLNLTNSSTLSVASQLGAVGGGKCTIATIRGVMVNNGTINVSSECSVYAYGFLKGIGTLNLASGSSLTDGMCSYDWPGGTASSNMYSKVFLTNSYSVHNTSCTTIINSGATYNVYLLANISSSAKSATVMLVGTSSASGSYLFKPSNSTGKITKSCQGQSALCAITADNQTVAYKDRFEIEGTWVDGSVSVTVYVTVSTSTSKPTPIGLMDIVMKSGSSLTLSKSDFLFMPGSSLTIEEGATVSVTNSDVDLTFATYNQIHDIGGNREFTLSTYSSDHNDAFLLCNGTFNCAGSFGGKIITTGENATVNFTNKVTSSYIYMMSTNSPYYKSGTANTKMNLYENGEIQSIKTISSKGTYYSIKDSNNNYGFYTTSGTLSFNTNGGTGTYSSKTITIGANGYTISSTDLPSSNPTKNFYSFGGWYTDNTFTTLALGYTTYCGLELYAKWDLINYEINYIDVYDGNFASGNTSTNTNPNTFNYETLQDLDEPVNGEYVFGGWYLDSSCTNKLTMLDGSILANHLSSNAVNIYALWYNTGTDRYVITYTNDNGNITCPSTDTIIDDGFDWSSYNLPIMNSGDNDYTISIYFGGWYSGTSLITSINSSLFTYNSTTGDYELELVANWIDKNALAIIVGSMGTIQTVYYKPGITFTIPTLESKNITLGQDGLVFINWQTNDGNTYNAGATITLNTQTQLTANIKQFFKLAIGTNDYTTVTVTLTKNAGYIVTYNEDTGVSSATAFNNETRTNSTSTYVTKDSSFTAKFAYSGNNDDGKATISGTTPTTALTTSNQTYVVVSNVTITPSGSNSSSCLLATSEVMLYDGTIKLAKDITANDIIVSFNHLTGQFEATKVSFNYIVDYAWLDIIELTFENGKVLKVATGHGMFNMDTNKYEIYYGNQFIDHIGETFATVDYIDGEFIITGSKLESVIVTEEYVQKYSPITEYNINCISDGVLTIPDDIEGMFDAFVFNNDLTINIELFANDIATYGLFEYDDLKDVVPEYVFDVVNFKYFKVFILKGLLTIDQVNHWMDCYAPTIIEQNNIDFDYVNRELLSEYHLYL